VPVLGTEQHPASLGPNDPRVRALCQRTLAKVHFDATAEGLLEALRAARPGVRQVVLGGCEAHVCVLQTALGLRAAGLEVAVVPRACGSRAPEDKALALQRLAQAGVALVSPEMVAYEWLEASTDPAFRQVLALVKARPVR
jgi:isochorismate hydrolase